MSAIFKEMYRGASIQAWPGLSGSFVPPAAVWHWVATAGGSRRLGAFQATHFAKSRGAAVRQARRTVDLLHKSLGRLMVPHV